MNSEIMHELSAEGRNFPTEVFPVDRDQLPENCRMDGPHGAKIFVGAFRIPLPPREVKYWNPMDSRLYKAIDRGWIVLMKRGFRPKAVAASISDGEIHTILRHDLLLVGDCPLDSDLPEVT